MTDIVYRVDKFQVPEAVREEFLVEVMKTHELLRRQPGFHHDLLLEQVSGPGELNIVTLAAWQDQESVAAAGAAIAESRRATGFDPAAFMSDLGVRADLANYREIA
jgi:hypothetical protein